MPKKSKKIAENKTVQKKPAVRPAVKDGMFNGKKAVKDPIFGEYCGSYEAVKKAEAQNPVPGIG